MDKYIELDADLLLLAAEGGDRNRQEVTRRLEEMTPEERRLLPIALERLDGLLDQVALESRLNRKK
jgi:hypothetical protein